MASTQIQTTTKIFTPMDGSGGNAIDFAGSRVWSQVDGGTDATNPVQCAWYSDNDGGSWTKHSQIQSTGAICSQVVYNDAGTWRVHFIDGNTTSTSGNLKHRAIHSNVASGVPGAASTSITIDAGGTNLSVRFPTIFASATRLWIVAHKMLTATTCELRVYYCNIGTAADTVGNWAFLSGESVATADRVMGIGTAWTVGGVEKVTVVYVTDANPGVMKSYTFDPTAATPALGTATTIQTLTSGQFPDFNVSRQFGVAAKADYLVVGSTQPDGSNIDFYKTVNGTSYSQPSGWANVTGGHPSIAWDGSKFQIIHTSTFTSTSAVGVASLVSRNIEPSNDVLSGTVAFSDTTGQVSSLAAKDGKLVGLYRALTVSPYSIRSDVYNSPVLPPVQRAGRRRPASQPAPSFAGSFAN